MPQPSEHESAVAAWLDDPTTQREIGVLVDRFPAWKYSEVVSFALLSEILSTLNVYGADDPAMRLYREDPSPGEDV